MAPVLNIVYKIYHMQQQNQEFLLKCINEIGSALLYNQNAGLSGLHTTIINALAVDSNFQLYALIEKKQAGFYSEYQSFPSELLFFRKGKSFYLKVWGNAVVLEDVASFNKVTGSSNMDKDAVCETAAVLKISIENIYYHEYRQPMYFGWKGRFKKIRDWFTGIKAFSFSLKPTPAFDANSYERAIA